MNKVALSTGATSRRIIYTYDTVAGPYTALAIFGAYINSRVHRVSFFGAIVLSIFLMLLDIIIVFINAVCENLHSQFGKLPRRVFSLFIIAVSWLTLLYCEVK